MYTIYKHTNTINNKAYVGITKHTMEVRWKGHIHASVSNKSTAFTNAIRKYGKDVWSHEVLEVVTDEDKQERERYWISYYDTYSSGYNSTLGGDYFDGYSPPKGDASPFAIKEVYTFYHRSHPAFTGTITQLADEYGLNRSSVRSLAHIRTIRSLKGWVMDPIHLYFRVGLARIKAPNVKHKSVKCKSSTKKREPYYKLCPICNSRSIAKVSKSCIDCRDTSGSRNSMFGVRQSQKAKDAVSNRMRNKVADQTLRSWVHSDHGIISNVRTIDLRDRLPQMNLSISSLKKVTDGKQNQHKGWYLHNEVRNN